MGEIIFKDVRSAFNKAMASGRLSRDRSAANYAGLYMYMGTWAGSDHFKNIITRAYLD